MVVDIEVISYADPGTFDSTKISDSIYTALNHTVSDGRIEIKDIDVDPGYIVTHTTILGKYI